MTDPHGRGPVDVAVVGAGLLGCAIARLAARAGARVLLFDQATAPNSALDPGFSTAQCDAEEPDPLFELRLRGRASLLPLLDALESETGVRVPRRAGGLILPALAVPELEALHGRASWQRRRQLGFESLTVGTALEREPDLTEETVAALSLPDERGIDAASLHGALLQAAVVAGVEVHLATPVLGLSRRPGRVEGLFIPEGSVSCGAVVIAAGAHSGVGGLPSAAVEPRRVCVATLGQRRGARHGVWHPDVRIAPSADGRVMLATPPERAGFDTRVPAGRLASLLSAAARLLPALVGLPFLGAGARLVSTSSDGRPLLGSTDAPNLLYACAFGEHSLSVAPAVAEVLVEYFQSGEAPAVFGAFSPLRFAT